MNSFYDKLNFPDVSDYLIKESYVRYGKNDLKEMSEADLKRELQRTEKEISDIEKEIDDNSSCPSYVLKEELENACLYKEKIENILSECKKDSNNKSDSHHKYKSNLSDYKK